MRTVLGRTDRVVVVGAGLAGLSTTLRLLAAGREVTVLERHHQPGGAANRIEIGGYRFDVGPTVLTMPELISETLGCVGERLTVPLSRLDPAYRAHFTDGSSLDVRTSVEATADEIARVCGPAEARGFEAFAGAAAKLYRLEFTRFIDRNLDSIADLARPQAAALLAAGGLRRLDRWLDRFFADPRTRRLFSFQALYAGLAPWQARAIYAVIPYLDTVRGVYHPTGGMAAVAAELAAAATRHGALIRYDEPAVHVELSGSRAIAVYTASGDRLPADVVVLAGGVQAGRALFGRPLGPSRATAPNLATAPSRRTAPSRATAPSRRTTTAPSCFLVLFGGSPCAKGSGPPAQHHLHFGTAWRATFEEVIKDGRLMSDPSLLVGCPAVSEPAVAPPGEHSHVLLAPVPNLSAPIDWASRGEAYADELRRRLVALGYPGPDSVRHIRHPAHWAADGYHLGSPFGPAHTVAQTGPFRQPTLDRDLDNVVYAGAGTQPGIGVPMVLLSGRLAAERIAGTQR
ncbi:MAG: phytoene desaturase family protein [Mycobacteriales bacterium]